MGNRGKILLAVSGLAVIVLLFVVLRPGDDARDEPAELAPAAGATTGSETGETETGESQTETEQNEEPSTTGPEEPSGPRTVRLDVTAGEGDIERIEVERGERVVLIVRADVSDHVHLHGYDLMADVAPGQPARIRFRADIPGRFEVELEDRGQHVAQLTVTQ